MRISSLHISLRTLCLLPALALGGCDPTLKLGEILGEDSSGDASDSASDSVSGTAGDSVSGTSNATGDDTGPGDATSEDPPASEATGDETATYGTGGTGGTGEPPGDDPVEPIVECDIWLQDCPDGEKCAPWAND